MAVRLPSASLLPSVCTPTLLLLLLPRLLDGPRRDAPRNFAFSEFLNIRRGRMWEQCPEGATLMSCLLGSCSRTAGQLFSLVEGNKGCPEVSPQLRVLKIWFWPRTWFCLIWRETGAYLGGGGDSPRNRPGIPEDEKIHSTSVVQKKHIFFLNISFFPFTEGKCGSEICLPRAKASQLSLP